MAGSATAHGFPTSFLLSPRSTGHFTYLLSSLQIKPKSSNFNLLNTCPLSHLCSSSANGSITDDNFFQQNKNLDSQESKGFWKKWKENSAEMSAKVAKLGLAAVLAYGIIDGVTYTSFFVLAFMGYEKTTGNNPAANLQSLLGKEHPELTIILMRII
ncbi:uncharacterized protein [Solanum lycopersicum]|uniref:uncharacterized protein isoform X2 n=1 Tax=Solanum lycopersicum TaxID=4081 RepID=UPI00374794B5